MVYTVRASYWLYASFKRLMSILTICSMASMTRFDFCGSLSCNSSFKTVGMICQDTPNLSCSQPHRFGVPPAESFVPQLVDFLLRRAVHKERDGGRELVHGPPLRAWNSWPSIWKVTDMTVPAGADAPSG